VPVPAQPTSATAIADIPNRPSSSVHGPGEPVDHRHASGSPVVVVKAVFR